MSDEPDAPRAVEQDDRFPSGKWVGFWVYKGRKERYGMELMLTFRDAVVTGEGRDYVGEFIIRGGYQLSDGKCWWAKRYLAKHDVSYQGFNEGKGIWGTWEIPNPLIDWRGGFHIWPEGMADPTVLRLSEEADVPAEPQTVEAEELVPAGAGTDR